MAKKRTPQQAEQWEQEPRRASANSNRPHTGNTDPRSRNRQAAPQKQTAKPKRTNKEAAAEESTPGNIMWRLALILCTGLVIFSLLFASVNGGSKLIGAPDKEDTTPTPPVSSVDPNVTITGSDATPIPPSPTPETSPNADQITEGGDTQTVTP